MLKTLLKGTLGVTAASCASGAAYVAYYENSRAATMLADHSDGPPFVQPAGPLPEFYPTPILAENLAVAEVSTCCDWLEGVTVHGVQVVSNVDAAMRATAEEDTTDHMMYMSTHVRQTIREHSDAAAEPESGERIKNAITWCNASRATADGQLPCARLTNAIHAYQKMMVSMAPDFEIMRAASATGSSAMLLVYGWETYQGTKDRTR